MSQDNKDELLKLFYKLGKPCIGCNILTTEQWENKDKLDLTVFSERCHLGGRPLAPKDFKWVYDIVCDYEDLEDNGPKNRPFSFIAQYDLSEVTQYDKENLLPKTGLLYFFLAMNSYEERALKVVYVKDFKKEELQYHDFPQDLPDNEEYRFPERYLYLSATENLPTCCICDDFEYPSHLSSDEIEMIEDNVDELLDAYYDQEDEKSKAGEETEITAKLLGYGEFIQDSFIKNDACILFELKSYMNPDKDRKWEFILGDAGSIYYAIEKEDLKEGRFDKIFGEWQCY